MIDADILVGAMEIAVGVTLTAADAVLKKMACLIYKVTFC